MSDDQAHQVVVRFQNSADALEAFDLIERLLPVELLQRSSLWLAPVFDDAPDECPGFP